MKKKYYYRGRVIISKGSLGHSFCLVENMDESLYFGGKERFCIGGVYEIDVNKKIGKIKLCSYCDEDIKDRSLAEKWQVESVMNENQHKSINIKKKLVKESKDIGHMRLDEIKARARTDRTFRRLVLYYLIEGGVFI